ncbi:thermonuclease family protein [Candidatus Omnitrophota bacterium]
MNKIQPLLLFILILILAGCYPPTTEGYYGAVKWVADGDTIKLANGEFVRYIGIDTPELNHKKGTPQYYAKEAKEFNEKLASGKVVRLEFDAERRDKYGRLLAYVFVDDTFVNARLIEEGYAKLLTIPPNIKYADDLLKLQREAKSERKGIWKE